MSGRYAFSLPDPRERDGWFKVGTLDVTTTIFIVGCGLLSMVVYAVNPDWPFEGAFQSELVRDGEIWRLFTWPLVDAPSLWSLVGLVFFWYFGNQVEEELGRKPYAILLATMTVLPAVIVTLLNVTNEVGTGRWSAYTVSSSLLSIAVFVIFALEHPNARFMFGIPAWVFAAAYVFITVLGGVGARAWAQLILALLVLAVGLVGARQRGMLEALSFIPQSKRLRPRYTPYGEVGSARPKARKRGRRPKGGSSGPTVVAGPWDRPLGPTPLEQAELDVLLDKISATGIDSLTKQEKDRLNFLSKRMRGG
jgi:membrane associated rhomboid family serine protease